MYIRELQLVGFKSFKDRATLSFAPGMNAVIGPNGCGKTNILDALRWVLGEQSFSVLRCARNEDLIFGGTATVPPTNYAEVKLVLGDEATGQDIEIRRRYFRSGESEYYLNRQPCRLRDIQEVFLSANAGTRAYSIFDLRQMREIISGNIRRLFEEAASLAKYHEAKADCLRKFELTDKDLVRLDDIIAERERLVRSLQRQAGRQRAWDRLKAEEKGLRLAELKAEWESVRTELERVVGDAETLESADAERTAEINRLEEEQQRLRARLRDQQAHREELDARLTAARQALAALENQNLLDGQRAEMLSAADREAAAELEGLQRQLSELETLFESATVRLAGADERQAEARSALEAARSTVEAAESRLLAARQSEADRQADLRELLEQQHAVRAELVRSEAAAENRSEARTRLLAEEQTLAERGKRLAAELEAVQARIAATAERLTAMRKRRQDLTVQLEQTARVRESARSEVERLRAEIAGLEVETAALRAELALEQAAAAETSLGCKVRAVSELVTVQPGWEVAAEAALGWLLDFLTAEREFSGEELRQLAAQRPDLNFGLLWNGSAAATPDLPQQPGIVGRLAEHVQLAAESPPAVSRALERVLVVEDVATVRGLAAQFADWVFVTVDGQCWFGDGRAVVAARDRGRLRLTGALRDKLERLTAARNEQELKLAEIARADRRLEELDRDNSALELEIAELENDRAGYDARAAVLAAQVEETGRDLERLQAEAGNLNEQDRQAATALAALRERLAEIDQQVRQAEKVLQQAGEETALREAAVKAGLEQSSAALAALAEARQSASRLEAETGFARRQIEEIRTRIGELERQAVLRREERTVLLAGIAARADELNAARQQVAEIEREIDGLRAADVARAEEELAANIAERRQQLEQSRRLLLDQRLRVHELRRQLDAVVEEARTSFGTDIAAFTAEGNGDVTVRLEQIRRRLEALGQVNPLAEQEYRQEKEDLERLRAQRADVAAARANLEQTLREIDERARSAFAATYAEVRGYFQTVFRRLFLEGEADLVMVDAANPLESEIAIVARPRGKNPKRLDQLSDGEKALLAVSLLFAFYQVKPAPFCFLDEVDAPLDDANVGRFADYLKEISRQTQVVIITHNRLTVERADVVFGVTAEEPGISTLVAISLADYQRRQDAATETAPG